MGWKFCSDHPGEWEYDGVSWISKSGQRRISSFTDQPETCISYYAESNPQDDWCESLVAYLCCPEILDTRKKEFIDKLVSDFSGIKVEIKEELEGPKSFNNRVPKTISYKKQKPLEISLG